MGTGYCSTCDLYLFIYRYIVIQYTSIYLYIIRYNTIIYIKKYTNTYTAPMALFFPFWPQITCWWMLLLQLRLVFVQRLLLLL